jgi:hypothetical protein
MAAKGWYTVMLSVIVRHAICRQPGAMSNHSEVAGTTDKARVMRSIPSSAWKSAYGVLAAMILTIPLGIGYFVYEGIFALLSDAGALVVGILLAPLVRGMRLLHEGDRLNNAVFGVGVVTVAGICLGSLGLVVMYLLTLDPGIYGSTLLGVQFAGWVLLGLWLLGVGILGRRNGAVS